MANIIDQLEVNYHDYEVCDSSARADIVIINDKFDDYATKEDLDDYATVTALNNAVEGLQESFQDGVDKVANACIGKGSTPVRPYTPDTVADAINAIPTGGGGSCYSMFPQEINKDGNQGACSGYRQDMIIDNNIDMFVAHILPTDANNSISINFNIDIYSYYTGTINFSLVIDNTTIIPNVGSVTIEESSEYTNCSFSYNLTNPLTQEYHVLSLKPISENVSSSIGYQCMCNIYGNGFTAVQDPGVYLINGNFINFIPNAIIPGNAYSTTLEHQDEYYPCYMESIVEAMNRDFDADDFNSGECFKLDGCSGYEQYNPESGGGNEYVPVEPADTLSFSNGKFVYTHAAKREYQDAIEPCYEIHCFLLPFTTKLLQVDRYINIHGTVTSGSEILQWQYDEVQPVVVARGNNGEIVQLMSGTTVTKMELSQGDEFIISLDLSNIENSAYNNNINFLGIYFNIQTGNNPFAIEIDKIQVANQPQNSGGGC